MLRRSAPNSMIRVVIFLLVAALLALGFAWFADRPGEVAVTWLGYRIETSLLVAAFAVALLRHSSFLSGAFIAQCCARPIRSHCSFVIAAARAAISPSRAA